MNQTTRDKLALDQIRELTERMLRSRERATFWGRAYLDEVATIVRATGRDVEGVG